MENDKNSSGVTDESSSGSSSVDAGNEGKESVAYSTYQKVLSEKKKRDQELADLKAWKSEQERKAQEAEESKLKEQGEYKKLLEQREKELQEERAKAQSLNSKITNAQKLSAFIKALPAGLESQYYDLVNLDEIAVNPETGEVDKASAERTAKEFAKKYARVLVDPSGPKLPQQAANGSTGKKVSYEEWLKLPLKDKKANYEAVFSDRYKK